ncbi:MAG TPA: DUF1573 domain-containing protein [Anaerolineae bacterium]|nr:DUF1573 domain-containing protein [Anaerolineae bacterium]
MSKKSRRSLSRRSPRHARRALPGANPLVWFGAILTIVVVLVGLNLWQTVSAEPPVTTRSEDVTALLPLAPERRPLTGGHDMTRLPRQTPAPQPVPEGAVLPAVDLPSAVYDFGRIPPDPEVAHVFAVQNRGEADLEIWNLVTSCGCTTARLSSSVIPPGQRADLLVTFDPDYHPTEGEVVRLVWFATNDPTQPWVEVRFSAEVE